MPILCPQGGTGIIISLRRGGGGGSVQLKIKITA